MTEVHLFRKVPLVSVIVAAYNHEHYVLESINSVLEQSVKDIEIIVIDDASTDSTADLVESIKDPRLKIIRQPTNRICNPRNLGIKNSSGKYIAFNNSDDSWDLKKLEKQLEIIQNQDGVSLCATNVEIIDESGKTNDDTWASGLFQTKYENRYEWLRSFYDVGNDLCLASTLMRREDLEEVGLFDESLFHLSDFDLWIRLTGLGHIEVCQEKLTKMRVLGMENMSSPKDKSHRINVIEQSKVYKRFEQSPIVDDLYRIFPDLVPEDESNVIQLASLCNISWNLSEIHRLWADSAFESLIQNVSQRKKIVEYFGRDIIQNFLNARSNLEVVIHD